MFLFLFFSFFNFFVKRHKPFQDYSKSFGEYRTVNTFFNFPPVSSSGVVIFNILMLLCLCIE